MEPASLLDTRIGDLLAADARAARVLMQRGMGCTGCAFAPFETVAEAAAAYGIDACELARALAAVITAAPTLERKS
jgi:hybrid cluster-associated redox disulfide protein